MMMEVYESMTQQDYQSDLRGFIEKRKKSLAVPGCDRCMLRDWADFNSVSYTHLTLPTICSV